MLNVAGVLAEQVTEGERIEDEEVRKKMLLALSLIRPLDFILNVWRVCQGFLLCPCFRDRMPLRKRAALQLVLLLPLPPKCWNYQCAPPHLVK